ncbi:BLUF domain-containing protein [Persicitalea jodogahamensis]|uniref:BluF domain-containing protein n=1 Tax=Persicitalea jodogahamensis TaxID=402147 RepID=A0A8J3DAL7_9BACT|nr:BLUF domain-containing protein [Persicitalea jodogahamensis]GHB83019.1 BluF domain-containing protein [Persicitalea jodogahamensis]
MYEITYCSTASPNLREEDIAAILEEARDHNMKSEISGCLLYHNREFIQILEGGKEVVQDLYSRIAQDDRHTNIVLLAEGGKADRSFYDWSMAFYELSQDDMQGIGREVFVDNFITFSKLAEKRTFPTILFWSMARQLLEK